MTDDMEWFLKTQLRNMQSSLNIAINVLLVIAVLLVLNLWRVW